MAHYNREWNEEISQSLLGEVAQFTGYLADIDMFRRDNVEKETEGVSGFFYWKGSKYQKDRNFERNRSSQDYAATEGASQISEHVKQAHKGDFLKYMQKRGKVSTTRAGSLYQCPPDRKFCVLIIEKRRNLIPIMEVDETEAVKERELTDEPVLPEIMQREGQNTPQQRLSSEYDSTCSPIREADIFNTSPVRPLTLPSTNTDFMVSGGYIEESQDALKHQQVEKATSMLLEVFRKHALSCSNREIAQDYIKYMRNQPR